MRTSAVRTSAVRTSAVTGAGIVVAALAACAPTVAGPAERQRAVDLEDGARLAAQLARLPGAVRADVTVRRPRVDPLAPAGPPPAATAAALLVVDDRADVARLRAAATTLLRAAAPEVAAPAIVIEVGAARPTLTRVGPFTVEARSKAPLQATLAGGLAVIAGLAGAVAWRARHRRGSSAQ